VSFTENIESLNVAQLRDAVRALQAERLQAGAY
jgi:hypothetical protein